MEYRQFVKTEMASRPAGVAPKTFMTEIGKKWREMKGTTTSTKRKVGKKMAEGEGITPISFDKVILDMKKENATKTLVPKKTAKKRKEVEQGQGFKRGGKLDTSKFNVGNTSMNAFLI